MSNEVFFAVIGALGLLAALVKFSMLRTDQEFRRQREAEDAAKAHPAE